LQGEGDQVRLLAVVGDQRDCSRVVCHDVFVSSLDPDKLHLV
jgi:hypothetical protein